MLHYHSEATLYHGLSAVAKLLLSFCSYKEWNCSF